MSSVWTFATVALAIGAAIIYQKPIANILTNIAQLCKMIFQLKDGFLTYEVRDNSGLVKLEMIPLSYVTNIKIGRRQQYTETTPTLQ
jgi:hypothetical protein